MSLGKSRGIKQEGRAAYCQEPSPPHFLEEEKLFQAKKEKGRTRGFHFQLGGGEKTDGSQQALKKSPCAIAGKRRKKKVLNHPYRKGGERGKEKDAHDIKKKRTRKMSYRKHQTSMSLTQLRLQRGRGFRLWLNGRGKGRQSLRVKSGGREKKIDYKRIVGLCPGEKYGRNFRRAGKEGAG